MPFKKQTSALIADQSCSQMNLSSNRRGTLDEITPLSTLNSSSGKKSWSFLRKVFKDKKTRETSEVENYKENTDPAAVIKFSRKKNSVCDKSYDQNVNKRLAVGQMSTKLPRLHNRVFSLESCENILHMHVLRSDVNSLLRLLQNTEININGMRSPGLSPLHQACVVGNLEIAEILLQYGANIELLTWSNLSPLLIANLFGHFELAQLLISRGASSQDIEHGFMFDVKLVSTVLDC